MEILSTLEWSVDDVCAWLRQNDLYELQGPFVQHAISGDALVELSREDLLEMKIERLGHMKKLEKLISQLKLKVPPAKPSPQQEHNDAQTLRAENKLLEAKCQSVREALKKQEETLDGLKQEEAQLRQHATQLEDEMNAKNNTQNIEELQSQISSTADNANTLKAEIQELEAQLYELREVMEAKQQELVELEGKLSQKMQAKQN